MTVHVRFTRWSAALIAVLGLAAAVALAPLTSAGADHMPANKVAAAGSGIEHLSTPVTGGAGSETVDLMSGRLRATNVTDLLIEVNAECALWTDVATVGSDDQQAFAQVKVWVEMVNQETGETRVVPVASDDEGEDAGKVVFCDRTYQRVTRFHGDDEDHEIDTFLRTRSANSFTWVDLNVGRGIWEIVVKAEINKQATSLGTANAAIGKRTLIVQPERFANDAQI
jgi:hypothetical protein